MSRKNSRTNERKIHIFDTTLRDGEQSPGASMGIEDKLRIAQQLAKMKVDTIEAGFPVSSPVQFEAVRLIARKVKGPVITGLSRAVKKDIDSCYAATKASSRPGIHTFIATSDIHLKYKLKITRERCLEMAAEAVRYARSKTDWVQFSAEDSSRSDPEFLAEVVRAVLKAGARVVNLPDTVGYAIPSESRRLVEEIRRKVPEIEGALLSVHNHNDLGLATANSLAMVEGGADQVEVSINGIGERAGNAALEEVVMGLVTRRPYFGVRCGVVTDEIYNASKLVSSVTGIHVQPNKAVVGENAFSHEAGIHQDGVLKDRRTYEIMDPKSIGVPSSKLVLGRHSGKHGFTKRLEELGLKVSPKEIEDLYVKFLGLADKKKQVYDEDLFALFSELRGGDGADLFSLDSFQVMSGSGILPIAAVRLSRGAKVLAPESATGDGPVDAIFKAVEKAVGFSVKLTDYKITALGSGKDALGEVSLIVEFERRRYAGHGSSTDIVEASAKAFLSAVNRVLLTK
jgi:2-isopropylmalate synthase